MSDLLFSLNITVPVFMLMIIGMVFRKFNWISENFANDMNKFVFKIALPVSVFKSMATASFQETMDIRFVLLCMAATILTILIDIGLGKYAARKEIRGEFIQAGFRSNTALLGMALVSSVYPNTIYAPLMLLGCVPIYNICSVAILTIYSPNNTKMGKGTVKKVLLGIIKNPIIIGLVLGIIWSFMQLPYPDILSKTVNYMANLATPMGLMAMGATFKVSEALDDIVPASIAVFMKLVGNVIIFMPIAFLMGFKGDAILSYLIMLGASQAIASYSMAKNMGYSGILTSTSLMLTTILCGFTLTFWIYLLKLLAWI